MDVRVVVGQVAVLLLADRIRQLAQKQQVGVLVKIQTVLQRNPLARLDNLGNLTQPNVTASCDRNLLCQ